MIKITNQFDNLLAIVSFIELNFVSIIDSYYY